MPSRMPLFRTISLMRSVTLISCVRSLVIQSTMRLNILKPAAAGAGELLSGVIISDSTGFALTELILAPSHFARLSAPAARGQAGGLPYKHQIAPIIAVAF